MNEIELPQEIYERIVIDDEIYIVVQVLPGRLAMCVKATDAAGGSNVLAVSLVKIP